MGRLVGRVVAGCLCLAALIWGVGRPAEAQSNAPASLELLTVDASAFPTVRLRLIARDELGNAWADLSTLQLTEDGREVPDFNLQTIPSGVDLTFVIDANDTIDGIDLVGDIPRLAKVRTSMADYANAYMSRTGQDRISVIVPAGDGARFLVEEATTPADVVAAIGDYNPTDLPPAAPIQAMLTLALEQARQRAIEARYQAIVLYSDAAGLGEQLSYPDLLALADASRVVVFGAILGSFADPSELTNMNGLTLPTGGYTRHMPTAADSDPLWRTIKSNAEQRELRFRSRLATSGEHSLRLTVGQASVETLLTVQIAPPGLEWVAPTAVVERQGEAAAPVEAYTPATTAVAVQVLWPDGQPRTLASATLLVNDLPQPAQGAPFLDATGQLTLEWDISRLGDGEYQLAVEVVDELGLSGRTPPRLQTISLATPVPPVTPTPGAVAPPVSGDADGAAYPLPTWVATLEEMRTRLNPTTLRLGLSGLIGVLALILGWKLWRRRRAAASQAVALKEEAPHPVSARPAAPGETRPAVYFVGLEHTPEYPSPIPLTGDALVIGSQVERVDVAFQHPTVARLHARLVYSHDLFLLYDEGSLNGTLVNGQRLGLAPHILRDGDEIHFGRVRVRFVHAPPVKTGAPPVKTGAHPPRLERNRPEIDSV